MDIYQYLKKHHQIALSEQQRAAVTQGGGVLLLAVPGAGKTTVVSARIAHLILNQGAAPKSIRTLTFSRESARDMAARFDRLFGELVQEKPSFSTIHAFCYRLLRSVRGTLPELLTDGKGAEIWRGIYRESAGRYGDDDLIDNLGRAYGLVRNRLEQPDSRHRAEFGIPGFVDLCRAYEAHKAREGLMDFDDMLMWTYEALTAQPNLSANIRATTPYLLLDEAQDTTALQFAIMHAIANPEQLFIVGDEDQSIYAFRGTSAKLMTDLPQRYPDIGVLKTEQTYRLTGTVAEAAGRLIAANRDRFKKQMTTERPKGAPITFESIASSSGQGDFVANAIGQLPAGDSVAVLYRNNPSVFGIADALDRTGIDFYVREQKLRFTKLGITADLLAFLGLSYNGGDLESFQRIYYKMGAYISRQMLDYVLRNTRPGDNVFDVLCESPHENMSTARIVYAQRQVARLRTLPTHKALDLIIEDLGYLEFLSGRAGGGVRLEQDAQLLDAFRAMAVRYPHVEDFLLRLHDLDAILLEHAGDGGDKRVTLSTIHSAKGMEFDHVFLVDFLDGVLPSAHALDEADSGHRTLLEEEVRLAYVAITRPRETLTLVCPEAIADRDLMPSRFLDPILAREAVPQHALVGCKLRHRHFGEGVIASVSEANRSFTVTFNKFGSKVLHLDILDNRAIVLQIEEPQP